MLSLSAATRKLEFPFPPPHFKLTLRTNLTYKIYLFTKRLSVSVSDSDHSLTRLYTITSLSATRITPLHAPTTVSFGARYDAVQITDSAYDYIIGPIQASPSFAHLARFIPVGIEVSHFLRPYGTRIPVQI